MEQERSNIKQQFGIKWIKSENGNTYLCPVGALDGIESPAESDLQRLCMDESNNPHNS